jgi:chemotaxis protein MotB
MPALSRRRSSQEGLNAWPGYVDALSTLLMVIIFVLLVFVLAQAFLSVALSGRDRALDRLNRQIAELSDMLSLERGRTSDLRASVAQLTRDLQSVTAARDALTQQLGTLRTSAEQAAQDHDSLKGERDKLAAQLADAQLQAQSAAARTHQLEAQVAEGASRNDTANQQAATLGGQLTDTQRQLAAAQDQLKQMRAQIAELDRTVSTSKDTIQARLSDIAKLNQQVQALTALRNDLQRQVQDATARADTEQHRREAVESQLAGERKSSSQQSAALNAQLADAQRQLADAQDQLKQMRAQMAELDRTVSADKDTIQARLSDIAKLNQQVKELTALRDELEQQAQNAAGRATTEQQRREAVESQLADEKKFSDSARAQIALLNQQIEQLRAQMQQVANALDISEKAGRDKDAQIVELGKKLNTALAAKVEELQRYRSEFFGRLRDVLQNRPGIQIVGDRFVFQSEVLFPVGSAELTGSGSEQIDKLASTLKGIAAEIPSDLSWILRVDGHADKQPITGGAFASNWELSTQRAVNVVKLLIKDGIPPNHLAATGFADFQPLANGDTPEDYAKNRRIELRLTDR